MIDTRTCEFVISPLALLKTSESTGKVKLRRLAIFVSEFPERLLASVGTLKVGNNAPPGNWSRRIDRVRNPGIRRHHQIPAHKRKRGGVAGVHFENDLADRRTTDKWRWPLRFRENASRYAQ